MTPAKPGRDRRLDFFRGLGLLFIFVNHIPENAFSFLTLSNFLFCDAAEIFVFLSGYAAAVVFGRRAGGEGNLFAMTQVLARVWTLYVAHIFLFVIYTAQVAWTAQSFDNPLFIEEMQIAAFLDRPHVAIVQALLLAHQPLFMNILPLYIALLLGFALLLPAIPRAGGALVVASAAVYACVPLFGWNLPAYPEGAWFFNPFAWQFLFVIGIACGWRAGVANAPIAAPEWLFRVSLAFLIVTIPFRTWVAIGYYFDVVPPAFAEIVYVFADKTNQGPLRLLSLLALVIVTVRLVPRGAGWMEARWVRAIERCGVNSLPIFCVGIFLSVLGHALLVEYGGTLANQAAVTAAGAFLLLVLGKLFSWYKGRARARPGARD
jgi:hypothetical protein